MSNVILQQNDTGIQFIVKIIDRNQLPAQKPLDISSATGLEIIFLKPDLTELVVNASFVTNGSDGLIQYVSGDGDLAQRGLWKIQARYNISSSLRYTSKDTFLVDYNL